MPTPVLAPYIKCYVYYRIDRDEIVPPIKSLPCGIPCITFNIADNFIVRSGRYCNRMERDDLLVGQQTSMYLLAPRGKLEQFIIFFQPTGVYRMLGLPLHEAIDGAVQLEDVLPVFRKFSFREAMHACRGNIQPTLQKLELFLQGLIRVDFRFPYIEHAVEWIMAQQGNVTVKALASDVNASVRNFRRRFNEIVGITPKQFIRIARFQSVIQTLQQSVHACEKKSWSAIAGDTGYFDQMHLIKDFKAFCGEIPTDYARRFFDDSYSLEREFLSRSR
jgi:AraC-like DNA-binding protein